MPVGNIPSPGTWTIVRSTTSAKAVPIYGQAGKVKCKKKAVGDPTAFFDIRKMITKN